jgi:hypothetical protein
MELSMREEFCIAGSAVARLWSVLALLLCASVVASGCASTVPNRDPVGERFPTVAGQSLEGEEVTLPGDYAGDPTLLLIGYKQRTQFDIDRWLLGLLQAETPVEFLEVPTVDGMLPGLYADSIDEGMRGGIPSEDWGGVVTLYGDAAEEVVEFTGNEEPISARVVLLDAQGRVIWFHDQGFSPRVMLELDRRCRQLADAGDGAPARDAGGDDGSEDGGVEGDLDGEGSTETDGGAGDSSEAAAP